MQKNSQVLGEGGSGSMPPKKRFEIYASETCISSILEQKLEFLDRTQISLNFSFLNSSCQLLWTIGCFSICFKSCKKWGNFQRDIEDITWLRGDTNFIFSCWKYLSRVSEANSWEILSAREDKIRNPKRPCNVLYIL